MDTSAARTDTVDELSGMEWQFDQCETRNIDFEPPAGQLVTVDLGLNPKLRQWDYSNPTSLLAGTRLQPLLDAGLERIKATRKIHRLLLVAGRTSSTTAGYASEVKQQLERHGAVSMFPGVTANSPVASMRECAAYMSGERVDAVVALGGGSVIDLAKIASSYCGRDIPADIEAVLEDQHGRIPSRSLPLIAIPTTAGTGSEVTPYAVLTGTTNRKLFGISPNLYPDVSIICSEFYASVPPKVIAEVGFDAFTHALEALWAKRASPISDTFALEALTRFHHYLREYYRSPSDTSLGYEVAIASAFAGLAFAAAYTSLCHALSFPLAELLHLSHGKCCALVAVQTAQFNGNYETPALQRLCNAIGIGHVAGLPAYVQALRTSLSDCDTLADFGLTVPDIRAVAKNVRVSMMENNGKRAHQSDLEWILSQAA